MSAEQKNESPDMGGGDPTFDVTTALVAGQAFFGGDKYDKDTVKAQNGLFKPCKCGHPFSDHGTKEDRYGSACQSMNCACRKYSEDREAKAENESGVCECGCKYSEHKEDGKGYRPCTKCDCDTYRTTTGPNSFRQHVKDAEKRGGY